MDEFKLLNKNMKKEKNKKARRAKLVVSGRGHGVKYLGNFSALMRSNKSTSLTGSNKVKQAVIESNLETVFEKENNFGTHNLQELVTDMRAALGQEWNIQKKKRKDRIENNKIETEWKKRMKDKEEKWNQRRESVLEHCIAFQGFKDCLCQGCDAVVEKASVRCNTCAMILCPMCDSITHHRSVLHDRNVLLDDMSLIHLAQNQFLSLSGVIIEEGILNNNVYDVYTTG